MKKATRTIYLGKCLTVNCNNEANEDTGFCKECSELYKQPKD